ncbi:MAG: hypothetical protein OEY89_12395 [Gammaproteobacteria bacterium]|nr:hypothetical protein [Gammaproteobacteria bacterium]
MKSFKAIFFGCMFVVIVGLVVQLAFIFLAVGYIELAKSLPFLNAIGDYFRYLVGFPVFFLIMFSGGYITAAMAEKNVILHCLIVGLLTVGTMLASAIYDYDLTVSGYFLFGLAMVFPVAGGWYWTKKNPGDTEVN